MSLASKQYFGLDQKSFILKAREDLAANRSLPDEEKVARDVEVLNAIKDYLEREKDVVALKKPLQVLDSALEDVLFEEEDDDELYSHIYDYAETLEEFFTDVLANPKANWNMKTQMSANLLAMFNKDPSTNIEAGKASDWIPPSTYGLGNSSRIISRKDEKEIKQEVIGRTYRFEMPVQVAESKDDTQLSDANGNIPSAKEDKYIAEEKAGGIIDSGHADSKDGGAEHLGHENDMFYKMFDDERVPSPRSIPNLDLQDKVGDQFQYTAWNKEILVKNREILEAKAEYKGGSIDDGTTREGSSEDEDEEWDSDEEEDDEDDEEYDEDAALGGMTMNPGLMRMLGMDVPDEEESTADSWVPPSHAGLDNSRRLI